MKKVILTVALMAMTSVSHAEEWFNVSAQALLVQDLNQTQMNRETTPAGPRANMSSLAMLGFKVSKISFPRDPGAEEFCSINVEMNRGGETKLYGFRLLTEKAFPIKWGPKQGKKYSDMSQSYRDAVSVCLTMTE